MASIDYTLNTCYSLNDSSCKSIQAFYENFNNAILNPRCESNTNEVQNIRSDEFNTFLTLIVSNDVDATDVPIHIDNNDVNGFNPYENILDHEDIYSNSSIEQNSLNDGYGDNELVWGTYPDVHSEESTASYLNLDNFSSQSNIVLETCFEEEVIKVNESLAEILQKPIPFTWKLKKSIERKSKRGRGRPRTELSKLEKKVIEAEKSKDKQKTRVTKNNKASKEYRDRRAEKKKQLDSDLNIETINYQRLRKIHTKLSERINKLEALLKTH